MIKRFFSVCFALLMVFSFSSCEKRIVYSDGIPCGEIMSTAERSVPTESGYEPMGQGRVEYAFGAAGCDDYTILVSAKTENIDEIGILHAPSEKEVNGLLAAVEKYLDDLLEEKGAFIASYAPSEVEKLEKAQVKVYGNYVAYAILSMEKQKLFFEAVENELKLNR